PRDAVTEWSAQNCGRVGVGADPSTRGARGACAPHPELNRTSCSKPLVFGGTHTESFAVVPGHSGLCSAAGTQPNRSASSGICAPVTTSPLVVAGPHADFEAAGRERGMGRAILPTASGIGPRDWHITSNVMRSSCRRSLLRRCAPTIGKYPLLQSRWRLQSELSITLSGLIGPASSRGSVGIISGDWHFTVRPEMIERTAAALFPPSLVALRGTERMERVVKGACPTPNRDRRDACPTLDSRFGNLRYRIAG